jgi:regulatory protein
MPIITSIIQQKRSPNRRNVHLDGAFAFGCNLNVVARFRLRPGLEVSAEQIEQIQQGEVKQECFDAAIRFLEIRLHGRAELKKKLMRKEWGEAVIDQVIENLQRLEYIDDLKFAKVKAASAAKHKHHGRRRAFMELMRSGVDRDVAEQALDEVYLKSDSLAVVRELVQKQATRLKRLEPMVARRRLIGMLQRRGFEYEVIKPVVDELLGEFTETYAKGNRRGAENAEIG